VEVAGVKGSEGGEGVKKGKGAGRVRVADSKRRSLVLCSTMPLSAEWGDTTGLEAPDRALASLQGCIQTGRLELVAFSGARYRSMLYLENAALPTFFATEEYKAITRDRGTCFA
jgi:hypothetical protein